MPELRKNILGPLCAKLLKVEHRNHERGFFFRTHKPVSGWAQILGEEGALRRRCVPRREVQAFEQVVANLPMAAKLQYVQTRTNGYVRCDLERFVAVPWDF